MGKSFITPVGQHVGGLILALGYCLLSPDLGSADASDELRFNTCFGSPAAHAHDLDHDGIADACEQAAAEHFAPVVYHASDEPNWPVNVLWVRQRSVLNATDWCWLTDHAPTIDVPPYHSHDLLDHSMWSTCEPTVVIASDTTRDSSKRTTYYLTTVEPHDRVGSRSPHDWTTYFHAYLNTFGGITIQYWRVYAYNTGRNIAGAVWGSHGGDWEGIHVVLNRELEPLGVHYLGHQSIDWVRWNDVPTDGSSDHPLVFSEPGGHTSRWVNTFLNLEDPHAYVRQDTWWGGFILQPGSVTGPEQTVTSPAQLVNLGERRHPMPGNEFIRYSGLWGSPSTHWFPWLHRIESGYWGPAFNETGMGEHNFLKAWCLWMLDTPKHECFPDIP